jgi:teichuronic acid biosynthesis glycosyltransferase TuaC
MAYFISASLFPSPVTPYTGLFVSHRLNALKNYLPEKTPIFIVSPTPYFPFKHDCFKHYSLYAQKPHDIIDYHGFKIAYPRYLQIPCTQSRFSGYFTYIAIKKYYYDFIKHHGLPKMLIAEYGFPDVLAIYELAQCYNLPYVVTLRGSDISHFMMIKAIRPKMIKALMNAHKIICVSNMMKQELHDIFNIPLDNITVIGNGVSKHIFKITDCDIRQKYALTTPHIICSVGGLIARKNHALAINAMQFLPNHSLLIVGTGEEHNALKQQINALNLQKKVFLLGAKPQEELAEIYSNSDLFLLCSLSEGRPNVVLEALACGTSVLTSAVQGVDELITHDAYGKILNMKPIEPKLLAETIEAMTHNQYNRKEIQEHGHKFSWEESAQIYGDIIFKKSV